ncbi:MAG: riboflavin biosynthesis protein RibF, partial [Synergistales bacterium]|nr:riboflavin biosynthesis protein RibF [Synergistales bacterium]
IVGENFRFGKQRTGNIEYLEYLCRQRGWIFRSLPLIEEKGFPISSTTIRGNISCGNVTKAKELLGYPFFISNRVLHGDKRGRRLGFPTVNILRDPHKVVPSDGVYSGIVVFDRTYRPAAINIGLNPTFSETDSLRIEAHLLDFEGDLYDRDVHLLFLERIRGELSFHSVDDLKYQIREDTEIVREVWSNILENDFKEIERFIHAIYI